MIEENRLKVNKNRLGYHNFVKGASLTFALIIAFWLPSYRWILSDFIAAWVLFSLLEFNFKNRFKLNLSNPFSNTLFVLQLILFLLISVEIVYSDEKTSVLKNILQKLSLFLFPILYALSGKQFKNKKYLFLKLFVLSNIIISLICLASATYHAVSFDENGSLIYKHAIYGYSFYRQSFLSVFHHRSYFSLYLVFSTAIMFYLKEKHEMFNSVMKKILFWLVIVFFILMIYLLESRAGTISLVILSAWLIFQRIFFSDRLFNKIIAIISVIALIGLLISNKRIKYTINQIENSENKTETIVGKNAPERLILWKSAIQIISDNFWTGIGNEHFHQKFNNIYKKNTGKSEKFVLNVNYNVHNQFLEEFVLYGIFGFLLLISLFIYPIIISFKRKNYLFLSFLLITGFNFLFESMLNTIAGIVFFAFFFNYFIFVFNEEDKKVIRSDI